jgi:hypothetical protein
MRPTVHSCETEIDDLARALQLQMIVHGRGDQWLQERYTAVLSQLHPISHNCIRKPLDGWHRSHLSTNQRRIPYVCKEALDYPSTHTVISLTYLLAKVPTLLLPNSDEHQPWLRSYQALSAVRT